MLHHLQVSVTGRQLTEADLASYQEFRRAVEKPPGEEHHARHIGRFYTCRGLRAVGYPEVYVLPDIEGPGWSLRPDALARRGGNLVLAYCAADSLDELPRADIRSALDMPGALIVLVVGNVLDLEALEREFHAELRSSRLQIRSFVRPPFDDVLEYDIWMFELAFKEVEAGR